MKNKWQAQNVPQTSKWVSTEIYEKVAVRVQISMFKYEPSLMGRIFFIVSVFSLIVHPYFWNDPIDQQIRSVNFWAGT